MKMKRIIPLLILVPLVASVAYGADTASTEAKDTRKGVRVDKLLKGEIQDVTSSPQQLGGAIPLHSEMFKPTLAEWKREGNKNLTKSPLVYEQDQTVPEFKKASVEEVSDLSKIQYFYNESLHAELIGRRAQEILKYTHSEGGKVFVSTTVDKIYPKKKYIDDDTGEAEFSQCVDITTRITVTRVPLINNFSVKELVDFWQDFKNYQCHSNSKND